MIHNDTRALAINEQQGSGPVEQKFDCSRRSFLGGALGAAAAGPLLAAATAPAAENPAAKAEPKRKIKLGLVGCGGRGSWLAGLFKQDGGFEMPPWPITSRKRRTSAATPWAWPGDDVSPVVSNRLTRSGH